MRTTIVVDATIDAGLASPQPRIDERSADRGDVGIERAQHAVLGPLRQSLTTGSYRSCGTVMASAGMGTSISTA